MVILKSLGLDLLAYQIHGRIRNTLVSARTILSPTDGTISNVQKLLAVSGVLTFAPPAVMTALVIRSSAKVTLVVTLSRTPTNTVVNLECNGLLVLTDSVISVVVTNPSALVTVDVSIVSI